MMEAVLFLLAGGAIAGFGILATRGRPRGWQDAAVACGLEITKVSPGWRPRLEARDGLGEVRIGLSVDRVRARIVVEVSRPTDFDLVKIRPQPPGFVPEIDLRDMAFDGEFHILGPALLVSALLDEETRRLLSLVNTEGRLEISAGALRVDLPDGKVPRVLPMLLDLRKRFAAPLHIPRRLADNARQDPVPGVRIHNLLLLINELPDAPETAEALRAVRSDPSPEVRLRIAIELESEGRDIRRALATDLQDDDASARALASVGGDLPFEQLRDLLDRALSRHRRQTAGACLTAIGYSGDAAAVEVLANVLEHDYGELAPVAARALGATGSPAAEPPLLQALERDHVDLQVAAAEALGRAGSAATVLPLKEVAERSSLDAGIRQAARRAIAEIQSRVLGA
ncbi:MAG TPA: HEAT repeat domain-containing protein, partial [Thermoanaerobaculia bacterium]